MYPLMAAHEDSGFYMDKCLIFSSYHGTYVHIHGHGQGFGKGYRESKLGRVEVGKGVGEDRLL